MVNRRDLSAVEVTEAALSRLELADASVRAFAERWPGLALREAALVDRAVRAGRRLPLAGVPAAVKASGRSGPAVAGRLREAGAVVLGWTSVPGPGTRWQTWGLTSRGPTLNPWRPDRVPSGSSAGSAAAVASGIVPIATGTDGAGSIRIPAAWCGVTGLKPTTTPGRTLPAVTGPITRTASDAAACLAAISPVRSAAGSPEPRGVRAVWSADLGYAGTGPEQISLARAAASLLAQAGVITWVDLPVRLLDPGAAWHASRGDHPDDSAATVITRHNDCALDAIFTRAGLLITPTTPAGPHPHPGPGPIINVALTWAFNLSGHPAISVPAGFDRDGCPAGLQFIARHGGETLLLRAATALEQLAPSLGSPPPDPATGQRQLVRPEVG